MNKFSLKVLIAGLGLLVSAACDSSGGGGGGGVSGAPPQQEGPKTGMGGGGGDVVGNGGGGVCIGTKCMTITEAGLRVGSPEERYYLLPPATNKALTDLAARIPFGNFREKVIEATLGKGENFIRLEIEDAAKIEQIRLQYAQLLKQTNSNIRIEDVKIFAFAKVEMGAFGYVKYLDETYLLPDFFKLDPIQQAKILIHERNVRGNQAQKFQQAVELDGLIEDLFVDPTLISKSQFRMDRWSELLPEFYFKYITSSTDLANWLAWYKDAKGIVFDASQFCDFRFSSCYINTAKILANYEISPSFLRFLKRESSSYDYEDKPLDLSLPEAQDFKSELQGACAKLNLVAETERVLLYPYKFYGVDYRMVLVYCSRDTYKSYTTAYLFRTR